MRKLICMLVILSGCTIPPKVIHAPLPDCLGTNVEWDEGTTPCDLNPPQTLDLLMKHDSGWVQRCLDFGGTPVADFYCVNVDY